jgi:hypothetical protein
MSTLVEIAEKADVAVEGVVRVLTLRPVSSAVSERVRAVLDQLDGEQAQVIERFARAAIPDLLPPKTPPPSRMPDRPLASVTAAARLPDRTRAPATVAARQLDRSLEDSGAALVRSERHPVPSNGADELALVAQLGTYLQELVASVNELQREGAALRQDRVADLAILVDLISSGSEGMDRRLGRLEQMVARIEATRR